LVAALADGMAAAMEISDIGGPLGPTTHQVLLSSVYGRRFLVTLQLAVAVVVVLRIDRPSLLRGRSSPTTARQGGPVVLVGALVVAAGFAGHASTGGPFATGVALRAAHLAGMGLWVGGLTTVVLVAPLAGTVGRRQLLASFARTAALGAVTTVVSGLVLAGREVTSLTALASTVFGRLLTGKVVVVLVLLGVGAWHARRIHGGRPVGRSTLRVEAVLGILVLGAGALLASGQPAVGKRFAPADRPSPTTRTVAAADLLVRLSLGPNHPGPNTPEVVVLETRRPSLGAINSVSLTLTTGSGEVLVRRGVPAPDGTVALDPVDLAAPGAVAAEVAVNRPKAPVPTARMTLTVDRSPTIRAATVVSDRRIGPLADRAAAGLVAVAAATWVAGRRRRRMLAAVVVLASIVAGCSGGSDPASSAFCKKQAEVARLGSATENVDDTDAPALRAAWDAYIREADAAAADAPATMRTDYRTYTAWLASLHGALERHDYSFGAALGDERFLETTNQEGVSSARANVDGYTLDRCKFKT
jgi:putative copper export protein